MGVCEDAPNEYCGHVLEPEDAGLNIEADGDWHEYIRNAVCLREPKYDGLCAWHADTYQKMVEELVEARLTPTDVPWEADYVNEHLGGAMLQGINFPKGFSFGRCILSLAKFSHADLRDAEFHDADLESAEFHNTDLESAEFHKADLPSAEFPRANLQNAEFPEAYLPSAEFHDAYLRNAEFPDARLPFAEFPDANLESAEFPDANLSFAEFHDANLSFAEFPDANLLEAKFPRANLFGAKFPHADLPSAEFPRADLESAEFPETNLTKTDLTETNLQKSEFSDADLQYVKFRPAFARVVASEHDTPTDPLGASLEDAQFEDGTDLRGADLSGARLYQTAFRDIRINDETRFGIEDENPYGTACRYEYDPNTGVCINEDTSRFEAAAWTYRRLESLFEENAMSERARNAHIRKEEAQRAGYEEQMQEDWPPIRVAMQAYHRVTSQIRLPQFPRLRPVSRWAVSRLNWHFHRHGESLRQLLKISALFIIGCGLLYPFVGGINSANSGGPYRITSLNEFVGMEAWVDMANGLYFSAITFTTIGYGDFYPAGTGSRILVALESLGGALLIALFVFVIGRRVAR